MIKYKDCINEIENGTKTCEFAQISIGEKVYDRRIKKEHYGPEYGNWGGKCSDCGIIVEVGNVHHYGCDMDICPKCDWQEILCTCTDLESLIGTDGKIIDISEENKEKMEEYY